jgi:hypothetical protein
MVIQIWEDLHNERAGYFRAFACDDGDAHLGDPVISYCSAGGSHRTIRATINELRRLGYGDDVYRNSRLIDRCPALPRRVA